MAELEAEPLPEEEDAGEEAAAEAVPQSRRRRLLLVAGAVAGLALLGGAGTYFSGVLDSPAEDGAEAVDPDNPEAAAEAIAAPIAPVLYDLPEFVVNLNTKGRKVRFLKLKTRLELTDSAHVRHVENALPRIVDVFQVYLRELRPEDLQGSAGPYRLREALMRRVNAEIMPVRAANVLFVEMFVQ